MGTMYLLPLRATGDELATRISAMLASPPMHELVTAFADSAADLDFAGDLADERGSLTDRLARFDTFSLRWETRQGRERDQAAELALTPAQARRALAVADAFGMRVALPPRFRGYDRLLVLGGSMRGCLVRTAFAAHLLDSGQVRAGSVAALGGHRPFGAAEFAQAAEAGAAELAEEYQALDYCMRQAFGLGKPETVTGVNSAVTGRTWGVRRYRTAAGLPVCVVAAPSSLPGTRRANTADTYEYFAREVDALERGARVLVVTTSINVPAQHAVALRVLGLPFGVEVDTVGSMPIPAGLTATSYLLEIRSTVRALHALCQSW